MPWPCRALAQEPIALPGGCSEGTLCLVLIQEVSPWLAISFAAWMLCAAARQFPQNLAASHAGVHARFPAWVWRFSRLNTRQQFPIVMPKHRAISTMAWKERFFSPCPAPQQKSDEHGHRRKTVPASSPLLCRVHVCDFPKRCVVPPVRPGRDQFHVEACPLRKSQSFHR